MVNRSDYVDQAGMTLIVKGINIANKPGEIGTPLPTTPETDPSFTSVTAATMTVGDLTLTAGDMEAVAAGSQAAHTHSLEIDIDGTTYWIMLSNTNANE